MTLEKNNKNIDGCGDKKMQTNCCAKILHLRKVHFYRALLRNCSWKNANYEL